MNTKQSFPTHTNSFDPSDSRDDGRSTEPEKQPQENARKTNRSMLLSSTTPQKPRILIVHDDDSIAKELEAVLSHAGLAYERVKTMRAGCESARSGLFQIVVAKPALADGSWKRLVRIDNHYRPGFVVILVATSFDLSDWGKALEDGAFDVLDALQEMPKAAEVVKRALWAAYLKGAGPRPEEPVPATIV